MPETLTQDDSTEAFTIEERVRLARARDVDYTQANNARIYNIKSVARFFVQFLAFRFTGRSPNFVKAFRDEIVDTEIHNVLQDMKIINNFSRMQNNLTPLKTPGDGNCLMHAVSLSIWFVNDSSTFLRRLVYATLLIDTGELRRRWELEHEQLNSAIPGLESMGFDTEWDLILSQSGTNNDTLTYSYAPLQGIHLFTLANILRRPIVVVSQPFITNSHGSLLQQNIIFGIYLPLLWKSEECCSKIPIVLAFHGNHFVPLVPFEAQAMAMASQSTNPAKPKYNSLPLFDTRHENLPIRFALVTEKQNYDVLLKKYLVIHEIMLQHSRDPSKNKLYYSAELSGEELPADIDTVGDKIALFSRTYVEPKVDKKTEMNREGEMDSLWENMAKVNVNELNKRVFAGFMLACINEGCKNPGVEKFGRLCPECFINNTVNLKGSAPVISDSDKIKATKTDDVVYRGDKENEAEFKVLKGPEELKLDIPSTNKKQTPNKLEKCKRCLTNLVHPATCAFCKDCLANILKDREGLLKSHLEPTQRSRSQLSGQTSPTLLYSADTSPKELIWKHNDLTKFGETHEDPLSQVQHRLNKTGHLVKFPTSPTNHKCVNPFCKIQVSEQQQLCSDCMHVLAREDDRKKAEAVAEALNHPVPCVTPNCQFYGSPKTGSLCSQCYRRNMQGGTKTGLTSAVNYRLPGKPTPVLQGPKCRVPECTRFGDTNMDGYCTSCYNNRSGTNLPSHSSPVKNIGSPAKPFLYPNQLYAANVTPYFPAGYYANYIPPETHPHRDPKVCRVCGRAFPSNLSSGMCTNCYIKTYGPDTVD